MHAAARMVSTWFLVGALAAPALGDPAPAPAPPREQPREQPRDLAREAARAYQAKDHPRFLALMRELYARDPSLPRTIYNLAAAHALAGTPDEAIALLGQLAATGLSFPIEADADFAALRDRPGFAAQVRAMQANLAPRGRAAPVLTLRERDLLVEGVAYDRATRSALLGSVRHRKIIAVDAAGRARDLVPQAQDGVGGVFGLAIDPARRALWAATTATPHMIGYRPEDKDAASLVRFDLKTGKQLAAYPVPRDGRPHVLGDVVVTSSGDAYTTDSLSPTVYRVDPQRGALEVVVEGGFRSLQGLALSADERRLYVADYARGIYAIDLSTKAVARLELAPGIAATGIDGLYLHRGRLIATQNGVRPSRVLALQLDAAGTKITGQSILLSGDPRTADLSLGALVGDQLYLNAASGWARYTDDGAVKPGTEPTTHTVLALPLGGAPAR